MSLMMSNDKGISAFPDGDKLFEWIATVNGPADSVYDGLKYKLRLEFPAAYPYTAPTVKFVTPCFHPNVDQHGNICLDILKEKWSALYEVRTILLSIQSLLGMNKILISNAEIFIYRAWNIVTPLVYRIYSYSFRTFMYCDLWPYVLYSFSKKEKVPRKLYEEIRYTRGVTIFQSL